ncbi:defective in cullin neddylation 1 domain containing SCCRO3 [Dermacentor variabilis]|uniref:defective in cullin neddylation 1 domain containing SCCRO3 n=1 Tax=Dermacentor variabilis TaxID=34621 RepID=UPI0021557FC5|nr:DCN1-like protein 3 [Dermacentor andersoni]XP_050029781.1 DCN1-like protein 3 [Dermacentor andersoni]
MGNALCCCLGQDASTGDNPLKFLDPACSKGGTTGVTNSQAAATGPAYAAGTSTTPTGGCGGLGSTVSSTPVTTPTGFAGLIANSAAATSESNVATSTAPAAAPRTSIGERFMFYPRLQRDAARRGTFEPRHSEARAGALFEKYRDSEEDAVLAEGIVRLCDDLGVRPEEFRVLLLAWKFGAQQMCRFTRDEFLGGCRALRADSISAIQARFPELLAEAREPTRFRDLYRFTFRFGLESGQRTLPTDMAAQLWRLVFSQEPPLVLERWLAFLETHPEVRGITSDTWNMFLHFAETAGRDLSTYDDSEAWPSLFDDFVEYENDQTNQNVLHQVNKGGSDVKAE